MTNPHHRAHTRHNTDTTPRAPREVAECGG